MMNCELMVKYIHFISMGRLLQYFSLSFENKTLKFYNSENVIKTTMFHCVQFICVLHGGVLFQHLSRFSLKYFQDKARWRESYV